MDRTLAASRATWEDSDDRKVIFGSRCSHLFISWRGGWRLYSSQVEQGGHHFLDNNGVHKSQTSNLTTNPSGSYLSNCLIESSLLSREQPTAVEGSALHLNSKEIQNPTSFKPVCIVSVHCQEHTRAFSRAEGCKIPTRRKSYGSRGTYFSMQLQVELENLLRTGAANDEVKTCPNILPLGRTHIKSCGLQY